jgi:DNA-binding NarL/FixJ family response regulator
VHNPKAYRGSRNLSKEWNNMKANVLIVDDNSMLRQTVRHILESNFSGLRVFEAADAKETFTQIHDHLPELIFMDIRLPGPNGLELTRKIKNVYPKVVIIILTNHDLREYREAALENGAEFFLSKSTLNKKTLTTVVKSKLVDASLNLKSIL